MGGIVTNGSNAITNNSQAWKLGYEQGARVSRVSGMLQGGASKPSSGCSPPPWGESWTAQIAANMTQVGFDAGLVIVTFQAHCPDDPSFQKMHTIYGDYYTVLTRCDLGAEFLIAPESRGGGCTRREIGVDVDARICTACGCPFCVRDTNGTFTTGQGQETVTSWSVPRSAVIRGELLTVYEGRAQGANAYDLRTSIAYNASGSPRFVNISHPLWINTVTSVEKFSHLVNASTFDIPEACRKDSN